MVDESHQLSCSRTPNFFCGCAHGRQGWGEVWCGAVLIIKTDHSHIFGNTFTCLTQSGQDANCGFVIPGKNGVKIHLCQDKFQNGAVGHFTIEFPG